MNSLQIMNGLYSRLPHSAIVRAQPVTASREKHSVISRRLANLSEVCLANRESSAVKSDCRRIRSN
jgi:hypothetical protein